MSDVIVIGVAGGTGSGKTTLVKALMNRFGDNISVLSHDNYYKRHDEMSYEERTHLNYDCPDAFDTDMMIEHLRMLKNGQAIDCPTYDYTIHNRADGVLIEPRKVIVVEGIMIFGAFIGVLFVRNMQSVQAIANAYANKQWLTLQGLELLAMLVAAALGALFSLLLSFASINLKADQTIGGTALNLLATAIAVVIAKYFSDSGSAKLNYSNKPFLFSIGGLELSIFVPLGIVLLVISYVVLYKTRFGLRLRACGEHPQAADSVGINVYKMRYAGVLLSGALGAIGGLAYIVPPVQTWNFEVGVAGAGFLALAVMIFGQWKPFNIFGAAMFFAVFKSLANIADSTFLAQLHWSSNIYNMMPFVASMVILAFTSKNSMAPKAEGIPYDKGSR